MKKIFLFLFSSIVIISCKKSDSIPACIQSAINANKNNPNWDVQEIDEYLFQNKIVYRFIGHREVDALDEIKSTDCSTLCAIGGIGNIMKCNGENFDSVAVFKRIIWKK
ncbi:MAG: DUF6970 domain-containing protein [Chitinophagaceae bacterium]